MAGAFVRDHVAEFVKTAGATDAYALTALVPAGNVLVAVCVFDNAATASKPIISSIDKPAGEANNWVFLGASRSTSTSAGAFASAEMWAIKTTVAWANATSITFTWDSSITMKAEDILEFTGCEAALRSTVGTAYSTTTTAASAATTGTTPAVGDVAVGLMFQSNTTSWSGSDTDVLGGSWSTTFGVGSTGNPASGNNWGVSTYKVLTAASHQTLNNSAALAAGNGCIVAILAQSPAITQAAYGFYADGTEVGSTALAAQNTAYTANIASGDVPLLLRVRLQETAGFAVSATDDFTLQVEKNASGTWLSLSGTNPAGVFASTNLTDGGATTNRLGAGTGSFVAGKVSEDGLADDVGWAGSNYTELLFALKVIAAQVTGSDVLRFRVVRNGSTTGMTYSQTPTLNISTGPPPTAPTTAPTLVIGTEVITVTAPALQGGATSYNFYRGATQIATFMAGGGQVSDSNASVLANQTYTVRGVNAGGESTDSPASVAAAANPGALTGSILPVGNPTQLRVGIDGLPYSVNLDVYRGPAGGSRTNVFGFGGITGPVASVDIGLTPGQRYDYHFIATAQTPTVHSGPSSPVYTAIPSYWLPHDTPNLSNSLVKAIWLPVLNLFLVGGSSKSLITSPDGRTWTTRTSNLAGAALNSMDWLAFNGTNLAVCSSGQAVSTSVNGTTWTSRASPLAQWCHACAFGAGLFCAVGDSGYIATSPDGITWTSRTSPFGTTPGSAICFGNGKFVAWANNLVSTSTDGITWATATTVTASNVWCQAVAWAAGIYVATFSNGTVYSSPDGVTWTLRYTFSGSPYVRALGFGNGSFFVGCDNPGRMATSPDGITWTSFAEPFQGVIYDVASNAASTTIAVSSQGLEAHTPWPTLGIAGLTDDFSSIADVPPWDIWGTGVTAPSGALVVAPAVSSTVYVGLSRTDYWALSGSSVYIEVPDAGNQAIASWEANPIILNNVAQTAHVQFTINTNKLTVNITGTGTFFTTPYNATNHRWLRMRENGGTLYFEAGSDGFSWSVLSQIATSALPAAFDMDRITFQISAGTFASVSPTTSMTVDHLNLPPGPQTSFLGAALAVTATLVPALVVIAKVDSAVLAVTGTISAGGVRTQPLAANALAVTATIGAAAAIVKPIDTTLAVTDTITAGGVRLAPASTTLAVTDTITAGAVLASAKATGAPLAVTASITGDATVIAGVKPIGATLAITVTLGAEAIGAFVDPTSLSGIRQWLDASDASSFTYSSGSLVSIWNDKSGSAKHMAQASVPLQPSRTGSRAGKPTVVFSNHYLSFSGITGLSLSAVTVFAVFAASTQVDYAGVFCAFGTTDDWDAPDGFSLALDSPASPGGPYVSQLSRASTTGNDGVAKAVGTMPSPWSITEGVLRPDGTLDIYVNGAKGSLSVPRLTTFGSASGYVMGGRFLSGVVDAGYRLIGEVGEVIVYKRVLSDAERLQVETYLTNKWLFSAVSADASLAVTASISTAGVRLAPAAVGLAATATVTAGAVRTAPAAANALAVTATTSADAFRAAPAAASLAVTDTITAGGVRTAPVAANTLAATATVTADALVTHPADVGLAATVTITAGGTRTQLIAANALAVTASIGAAVTPAYAAVVSLPVTATLTAGGFRLAPVDANALAVTATITPAVTGGAPIAAIAVAVTATVSTGFLLIGAVGATLAVTATITTDAISGIQLIPYLKMQSAIQVDSGDTPISTFSVPVPPLLLAVGDFMVATVVTNGVGINAKALWNDIASLTVASNPRQRVMWHIATAADVIAATIDFTTVSATYGEAVIQTFGNVDQNTPMDFAATVIDTASTITAFALPAGTVVAPNTLLIAGVASNTGVTTVTWTAPAGWVKTFDPQSLTGTSIQKGKSHARGQALAGSAAGTTGIVNWTLSSARAGNGWLAGLRAAPVLVRPADVTLPVTATITAGAAPVAALTGGLAVTATISADATVLHPVAVTGLAATATITAGGVRTAPAQAALAVTATIAPAVPDRVAPVGVTQAVTVTIITGGIAGTGLGAGASLVVTAAAVAAMTVSAMMQAVLSVTATVTPAPLVTKVTGVGLVIIATTSADAEAGVPADYPVRRWNGTTWVIVASTRIKRWNGTTYVQANPKAYIDGNYEIVG